MNAGFHVYSNPENSAVPMDTLRAAVGAENSERQNLHYLIKSFTHLE